MQVQEFLAENNVPFNAIHHRRTFGALRMAESLAVSGSLVGKSVLLEVDGSPVLAVLPATRRVDPALVQEELGATEVTLMSEERCQQVFPDCERGSLPPFGKAKGLRTIVDRLLTVQDDFIFEGNRHDETIHMKIADYERLERPLIANISRPLN